MLQKSIYIFILLLISSCYTILRPELKKSEKILKIETRNYFVITDFNYFKGFLDTNIIFENYYKPKYEFTDTVVFNMDSIYRTNEDTITITYIDYKRSFAKFLDSENYFVYDSTDRKLEKIKIKKSRMRKPIHGIIGHDHYVNPETNESIFINTIYKGIKVRF